MVGLQGSGKTTTSAKLALRARKAGDRPLLIAADVYRPAAIDQLQALGRQLDIEVFELGADRKPAIIVEQGLERAAQIGAGTVIVDTAGRLHVDDEMMSEITELRNRFEPTEVLLVADAMSGQDAVNAASAFDEAVGITGVVLSKMDGDARGGAALSIRAVNGASRSSSSALASAPTRLSSSIPVDSPDASSGAATCRRLSNAPPKSSANRTPRFGANDSSKANSTSTTSSISSARSARWDRSRRSST